MDFKMLLGQYWSDVAGQRDDQLKAYFLPDAAVCWHNTNERFTVDQFIRANCEYPGRWKGEIERLEAMEELVVTVSRVWPADESMSFHVVSFFRFKDEKIAALDEYWSDDGPPPQWRQDLAIGQPIK